MPLSLTLWGKAHTFGNNLEGARQFIPALLEALAIVVVAIVAHKLYRTKIKGRQKKEQRLNPLFLLITLIRKGEKKWRIWI